MIRILIAPTTFEILPSQDGQNPYIHEEDLSKKKAQTQHASLARTLSKAYVYTLPPITVSLPDIVFTANAGLALPRLASPCVLLPNMKYAQRKDELPYLHTMFQSLGIQTIPYLGKEPFEGQAELKWFHGGRKAVCGYGHRSTRKTFTELDTFFKRLYGIRNAPELLILPLASEDYYHLDIAMFEYAKDSLEVNRCIVHERAFSTKSLQRLRAFLGYDNVMVLDTEDAFCLNAIADGPHMITHKLTDPTLKRRLETWTGLRVLQVPTTEFEKSGGSVRCMVLDVV
jgi:N-dimethylarginine dimethylaminohydrolase